MQPKHRIILALLLMVLVGGHTLFAQTTPSEELPTKDRKLAEVTNPSEEKDWSDEFLVNEREQLNFGVNYYVLAFAYGRGITESMFGTGALIEYMPVKYLLFGYERKIITSVNVDTKDKSIFFIPATGAADSLSFRFKFTHKIPNFINGDCYVGVQFGGLVMSGYYTVKDPDYFIQNEKQTHWWFNGVMANIRIDLDIPIAKNLVIGPMYEPQTIGYFNSNRLAAYDRAYGTKKRSNAFGQFNLGFHLGYVWP